MIQKHSKTKSVSSVIRIMHDTKAIMEILKSQENTINKRIFKKMKAFHLRWWDGKGVLIADDY